MDISMFDWPEQSQTSPTRMSLTTTAGPFAPRTVISRAAPPALSGSKTTRHLPSAPATALRSWPLKATVTGSAFPAQPQTATGLSCWTTMWSPMTAGSRTWAARAAGRAATRSAARTGAASASAVHLLVDRAMIPSRIFDSQTYHVEDIVPAAPSQGAVRTLRRPARLF